MTKPKQPKPVKAWGIVDEYGDITVSLCFKTRKNARDSAMKGERIVRVEIKVVT